MFIVVTGPESSGKTKLAAYIAEHLPAILVEEKARVILNVLERKYNLHDIIGIAGEQRDAVCAAIESDQGHAVSDTFMLELRVWTEERFDGEPDEIRDIRRAHKPDAYILCKPDIPWEPDSLRENPLDRERLFKIYHKYVQQSGVPYVLASGSGPGRFDHVMKVLREMAEKNLP